MSTELDLDAIKARVDAATPGEWFFAYNKIFAGGKVSAEEAWIEALGSDDHTLDQHPREPCGGGKCNLRSKALDMDPVVARVEPSYGDTATGQRVLDAEFIAHAREDVPALIAEVERLRAEVARASDVGCGGPECRMTALHRVNTCPRYAEDDEA
jgi:hypothetical protein